MLRVEITECFMSGERDTSGVIRAESRRPWVKIYAKRKAPAASKLQPSCCLESILR